MLSKELEHVITNMPTVYEDMKEVISYLAKYDTKTASLIAKEFKAMVKCHYSAPSEDVNDAYTAVYSALVNVMVTKYPGIPDVHIQNMASAAMRLLDTAISMREEQFMTGRFTNEASCIFQATPQ